MKKTTTIFNKISYVLVGILITSLIFSITLKYFQEPGIWIGIVLTLIVSSLGFFYSKKYQPLKLISAGILGTLIVVGILYFVLITSFTNTFEDISG